MEYIPLGGCRPSTFPIRREKNSGPFRLPLDRMHTFLAIMKAVADNGGADMRFSYELRKAFGRGRGKIHAILTVKLMTAVL